MTSVHIHVKKKSETEIMQLN